jgi:hypothetical protein
MAIEHDAIPNADLHEPKGVNAATSGQVYVADGVGSGAWTTKNYYDKVYLSTHYNDLDATTSHFLVSPVAGTVTKIWSVIDQAIATADTTLTAKIGGVAVTNGVITIAYSGSAGGNVDSCTPTALNSVSAGTAIEFVSGGQTNTAGAHAHITVEITRS